MISSSDEAIDDSDDEELPMIKEEDEDMYFEELREKTWSSPSMVSINEAKQPL